MAPNLGALIAGLHESVERYVKAAYDTLAARVGALESRPTADADAIRGIVAEAVAAMPRPKDGEDGKVDPELVRVVVAETLPGMVDRAREMLREHIDGALPSLKGKPGEPGTNGLNGQSAYQLAVEKGFPGTELQWLESLHGRPGDPGRDGSGKDGEHGRDAALIEPLASIDPARSYPRGTWAKHERGLWLARAPTDGMTGWDCVVAGLSSWEVTQDDERNFVARARLSDGTAVNHKFSLPVLIYREVWREGDYDRGDVVTWGGSAWHCQRPTQEKPGFGCADWKLMVKEGRPGKDAGPVQAASREPVKLK